MDDKHNTNQESLIKSFWITANAGSGKTTALVRKFLELVHNGLKPEEIFCITYTRIGAKEMIERIVDLAKKEKIFITKSSLKISTIHSLCKDLLERSGKINNVDIFDGNERLKKRIIDYIVEKVGNYGDFFNNANEQEDSDKRQAVAESLKKSVSEVLNNLSKIESINGFRDLVEKIIKKQNAFLLLFSNISRGEKKIEQSNDILVNVDFDRIVDLLPNKLSVFAKNYNQDGLEKTKQELQNELKKNDALYLSSVASEILGEKEFVKLGQDFDFKNIENWQNIVLTKDKKRRKKVDKVANLLIKDLQNYFVQKFLFIGVNSTLSVLRFAYVVLKEYQAIKIRMNVITYDDILLQALQAIKSGEIIEKDNDKQSGKLCGYKIKYLMLDEAQDTNPISWEIIENIVNGCGCNFFVVGDKKQSIYRFQGARVEEYERNKEIFKGLAKEFNFVFDDKSNLEVSYRSLPSILKIADTFCNTNGIRENFITNQEESVVHIFNNKILAGKDERYNLVGDKSIIFKDIDDFGFQQEENITNVKQKSENGEEKSLWLNRFDNELKKQLEKSKHNDLIAEEIAKYVKLNQDEIKSGIIDAKYNRVALIYPKVNSSGDIFDIVAVLRDKYGIDVELKPQVEKNSIYFYDLLAFFKFACLQYDNLNLAILLKSDFFGFDDELLQKICISGKKIDINNSLWLKLQKQFLQNEADRDKVKYATDVLKKIIACLSVEDVFEVVKQTITAKNCDSNNDVQKYKSALRLMAFCVDKYKDEYNYDLRGFLNAVEDEKFEDYDNEGEANPNDKSGIYLSTIHGVKGMEFDTVIFYYPEMKASNSDKFLFFQNQFWYQSSGGKLQEDDERCEEILKAIEEDKKQTESEKYRLFYVAITRTRRRLVYIGRASDNCKKGEEDNFYRHLFSQQ